MPGPASPDLLLAALAVPAVLGEESDRAAIEGLRERLREFTPDLGFFYHAGGGAGQTELLAGAIRRWLPGEAGRRRVRAHLRGEAADLVPQQIGRARADLQYRLAEATRRLVRTAQARYDEGTGRLERALRDAAQSRQATAADAAARDHGLAGRLTALDHVLSLLDAAIADSEPAMLVGGGYDSAAAGRPDNRSADPVTVARSGRAEAAVDRAAGDPGPEGVG